MKSVKKIVKVVLHSFASVFTTAASYPGVDLYSFYDPYSFIDEEKKTKFHID
jgi:hypothetical protein